MTEKQRAIGTISGLLNDERIPHHLELRMGPGEKIIPLDQADCIHLTWFLDDALPNLQLTCTFQDRWLDILGFADVDGGPIPMGDSARDNVIRLLNLVNGYAKFGGTFYLDPDTSDVACAGRIPYSLLERAPDYALEIILSIRQFFCLIGSPLMDVAAGRQTPEEAFEIILGGQSK